MIPCGLPAAPSRFRTRLLRFPPVSFHFLPHTHRYSGCTDAASQGHRQPLPYHQYRTSTRDAHLCFPNVSKGEGNGTPLQYSCLENPMDGGAWKAAVHGVAKSRTQLSDFTFTFHFMHWRRKWQPAPVFLPGESQGRESLVGCRLWGRSRTRLK